MTAVLEGKYVFRKWKHCSVVCKYIYKMAAKQSFSIWPLSGKVGAVMARVSVHWMKYFDFISASYK